MRDGCRRAIVTTGRRVSGAALRLLIARARTMLAGPSVSPVVNRITVRALCPADVCVCNTRFYRPKSSVAVFAFISHLFFARRRRTIYSATIELKNIGTRKKKKERKKRAKPAKKRTPPQPSPAQYNMWYPPSTSSYPSTFFCLVYSVLGHLELHTHTHTRYMPTGAPVLRAECPPRAVVRRRPFSMSVVRFFFFRSCRPRSMTGRSRSSDLHCNR